MVEKRILYRSASHAQNLDNMRLINKWCDVTIKVNEREIRAHKIILAANLKYFDVMLSSDSFQESKEGVINMECVKMADLEAFVSYAYTGEIMLTDSNALDLLELANYLSEDGIKEACIEFLNEHLKSDEACRAYKLANSINCSSLKNAAKQIILSNFVDCSETTEYLDFDYEHLIDILSDGKAKGAQAQLKLFEGIMRWIMHDVKERRSRVDSLLNSIDLAKLSSDELMGCLYGNMMIVSEDKQFCSSLRDDVMFCYHANKKQKTNRQALMILGFNNGKFNFQLYDFAKKKCSQLQEIAYFYDNVPLTVAVLNDELYYIAQKSNSRYLNVFSPTTNRNSALYSSTSILSCSALCTSSRFLYLCGGMNKDGSRSDQVLRYDPLKNLLETLTPMEYRRSLPAVIFFQGSLYALGGYDGFNWLNSVEKYDPYTMWTACPPMCVARSSHAVVVMDEKLYVCGGRNGNTLVCSVEFYDPSKNSWQLVAGMKKCRANFFVLAHEGKLLAIGGDDEMTIEVYDSRKDEWQIDQEICTGLQIKYLQGGIIASNCIADAD